ncbi:hypothetical protein TNIN_308771 [Trichonephila inaurata madagascariensis]|uniref:Uncharacterized protein n=1 Tax=Trichonephila inaurata madagascariensis TaxID=2747483 RepID=A0A8X6X7P5_9ARAC|nr:hypothetical protein TNIN_308771 [Trichonephila inaurata madagascariensis]
MHYEKFFPNFDYEFSLIHGPSDLKTARKRCKNMKMELFKPNSWKEVTGVKKMFIPKMREFLLGEGKEIWSDITFCSVEELDSWIGNKPSTDDPVNVTPSNDSVSITPSNDSISITPSNDSISITPPNENVSITPLNDSVSITPSNDSVSITPSNDSLITPQTKIWHTHK